MKENKVLNQLKDKAIWLVLIVLVIVFTIANPRFISASNLLTLLRQVSMYGIASIGMTFVILLGDIDLSTGTIISFVNIICAYMMVNMGMNPILAVLVSMVAATLIGVLNGFMVSTIGIPAIIATYASQTASMVWHLSFAVVCRSADSLMDLLLLVRDMLVSFRFRLLSWQFVLLLVPLS